ncbi:MAG TPA: hypothetical protein PKY77_11220 [Phycisphaerae bacterium]|nr:hypothetical protein [Phycisphaerae bacterium]HOW71163.1 hypothetical protein [Phycisphaerae bacterium]HRY67079.1 hypothetical protein [Phycisphaerae bacterium]HSA26552.1 hypothetical protein [Phycisphaerae bacterium]
MHRLLTRLFRAMMVLSMAALPAYTIDCDHEDGELEIDIDHHGCHDYCDDDSWYWWTDVYGW